MTPLDHALVVLSTAVSVSGPRHGLDVGGHVLITRRWGAGYRYRFVDGALLGLPVAWVGGKRMAAALVERWGDGLAAQLEHAAKAVNPEAPPEADAGDDGQLWQAWSPRRRTGCGHRHQTAEAAERCAAERGVDWRAATYANPDQAAGNRCVVCQTPIKAGRARCAQRTCQRQLPLF